MTIDKAIKEFTEWAKNDRDEMNYWLSQRDQSDENSPLSYADCRAFAGDAEASAERYEQLAEWLTELKQWRRVYGVCPSYEMCIPECKEGYNAQIAEYKRLLKAAVEDMNSNNICFDINACNVCAEKNCISCDTFYWRYTDEAEKLLNNEK